MVDVTKFNIEEMMPDIEESIKNASFIALDAEFTGLKVGDGDRFSLFDSMEERYRKLKIRASSFTVSQIGLAAFKKHPTENSYQVKVYVFYIRPYLCGNIDRTFMCQASCLDFLCRYDFDFNKVFKEGIPFMNETEVEQFKAELEEDKFIFPYNFLDREKDILINDTLLKSDKGIDKKSKFRKGDRASSPDSPKKVVRLPKDKLYPAYFQIVQLNNKYPTLSAYATENEIIVEKGSARKEPNYMTIEKEKALNFCLGFTKVFRLLKEAKKPIVGHNFLMDLLLFFQNFHRPLPDDYKKFKEELHSAFPVIYDTRQIWRNIRKLNILKKAPPHCGLFELYELFKNTNGCVLLKRTNEDGARVQGCQCVGDAIFNANNQKVDGEYPHESGYDSYVTGYVFLNICHIIAIKKAKNPIFIEPQTFKQHLNAVAPFVNKVNLGRARYLFIDFAGEDPSPSVPEYLHVCKKSKEIISEQELAVVFDKYGVIDVKLFPDKRQAIIAVSTPTIFREILAEFEHHDELVITKYQILKHSSLNKILWLTAVGSVCIVAFLIAKLT